MRNWFRFDNVASDPATVDIHLVDLIGGWFDEYLSEGGGPGVVTAKAFLEQLVALPDLVKTIRLHVNSPGGDVFAAIAMTNALRDERLTKGRRVDVTIEGAALSAASIVVMAGQTIRIVDNGLIMIHNPVGICAGVAADMRKVAAELDTVRDAIIETYRWHAKPSAAAIAKLMEAETWMDADEAVANGFATEKVEGLRAAAAFDPRAIAKLAIPDQYRARVDALVAKATPPARVEPFVPRRVPGAAPSSSPAPALDVVRLCREGECLDQAEALVNAGASLDQVTAHVAAVRVGRQSAAHRAQEITALCRLAHMSNLAQSYIDGGMPVDTVRAQLLAVTALADGAIEIDGSLSPDAGKSKGRVVADAVYSERNRGREV